ncbi:hypothetical protein CXF68_14315 [Tenacibaculum sp. Bg11-29]|uniref:DUF481 domain-containing protein n=1 Tax=Tenacibaculum sp. Bg11-29 TaxID=2058306 RepID=UPI000C338897|nr:DUF481 domain-containing protein [Tenacibaculum sp. Bg11-29]PKH51786.1 hypothetical protein CXF68_14315 [Tenacibaculum sp. Bg11-29]
MHLRILVIIFLFLSGYTFSQKTEGLTTVKDSLKVDGSLSLMANFQTGTIDETLLTGRGEINFKKNNNRLNLGLNYKFLSVEDFELDSDYYVHASYNLKEHNKLYFTYSVNISKANSYSLDYAFLTGPGVAWNIHQKSEQNYVDLGIYVGYMAVKFAPFNKHESASTGLRLRSHFPVTKTMGIRYSIDTYLSFSDSDYSGIESRLDVFFDISKSLKFNISYSVWHNSKEVPMAEKTNSVLTPGLTLNF